MKQSVTPQLSQENDGISYIRKQHQLLLHLCAQYDPHVSDIHDIIKQICACISLEEVILYPTLKRLLADEGEKLQNEGRYSLNHITSTLQNLLDMNIKDPDYLPTFVKLFSKLQEYFQWEQEAVLPKMRENMTTEQKSLLYDALNEAKTIAPHNPTFSKLWLFGPHAAPYEKLKDSLHSSYH
jgi:hypothetical protein